LRRRKVAAARDCGAAKECVGGGCRLQRP
jgi:hypothetical protein